MGSPRPAWGALLLERAGNEIFSSEEFALISEFVKLTVLHIDQAMAAVSLRRTAEIDALTGSFNRRSIDQWLSRSFSEAHRDNQPLSVLFVDLDHFKAITTGSATRAAIIACASWRPPCAGARRRRLFGRTAAKNSSPSCPVAAARRRG